MTTEKSISLPGILKIFQLFLRSHIFRPPADWGLLCDARCTVLLVVKRKQQCIILRPYINWHNKKNNNQNLFHIFIIYKDS